MAGGGGARAAVWRAGGRADGAGAAVPARGTRPDVEGPGCRRAARCARAAASRDPATPTRTAISRTRPVIVAACNDGTRILNGDHAERAGSAPLRVELHAPAHRSPPSTIPKILMVRWRDLSAREGAILPFPRNPCRYPRSVVAEASVSADPSTRCARSG